MRIPVTRFGEHNLGITLTPMFGPRSIGLNFHGND
jgi:hypothetical protein